MDQPTAVGSDPSNIEDTKLPCSIPDVELSATEKTHEEL